MVDSYVPGMTIYSRCYYFSDFTDEENWATERVRGLPQVTQPRGWRPGFEPSTPGFRGLHSPLHCSDSPRSVKTMALQALRFIAYNQEINLRAKWNDNTWMALTGRPGTQWAVSHVHHDLSFLCPLLPSPPPPLLLLGMKGSNKQVRNKEKFKNHFSFKKKNTSPR